MIVKMQWTITLSIIDHRWLHKPRKIPPQSRIEVSTPLSEDYRCTVMQTGYLLIGFLKVIELFQSLPDIIRNISIFRIEIGYEAKYLKE